MDEESTGAVELLIEHELAAKHLYEAFAAAFGERAEFWHRLAADEQRHAERLETLRSEPGIDEQLLRGGRLRPQAIRSSIEYVEDQAARAQGGGLTPVQALSIAKDLEDALIEKGFSRMGESSRVEVRSILADLAAQTEAHRQVLAEALGAERG